MNTAMKASWVHSCKIHEAGKDDTKNRSHESGKKNNHYKGKLFRLCSLLASASFLTDRKGISGGLSSDNSVGGAYKEHAD